MIRKTKEPEKTISGLIKTVFDWDNLDLIEEAKELLSCIFEPAPRKEPELVGDLRVDEYGMIAMPPVKPTPIDTTNWKRMTPKRVEMLTNYRLELAEYETAMKKYLELPLLDDGRSVEEHRSEFLRKNKVPHGMNHRTYYDFMNGVFDPEIPVLRYWVRGYGEVCVLEFPRFHSSKYAWFHQPKRDDTEESTLSEWMGELPEINHVSRGYKRNRDINEVLTRTDQLSLFNCRTKDSGIRIVDYGLLESFGTKPNKYLANAYLDYLLRGTPLTDWQKFQINKRMTKTIVKEGQQTLL